MENELRYYLGEIKRAMAEPTEEEKANGREAFKPRYIVTAVKLPTGAIELAVNTENIAEKIDYILEAYDQDMHLKTNTAVVMQNLMVV
jgi:hypothetical protein